MSTALDSEVDTCVSPPSSVIWYRAKGGMGWDGKITAASQKITSANCWVYKQVICRLIVQKLLNLQKNTKTFRPTINTPSRTQEWCQQMLKKTLKQTV